MSANEAAQIRQLEIRMGVPDIGDEDYVYPVARLLIDGQDPLADIGKSGKVPWPAHQLLTDNAPLLPAELPRRVVVYAESPDPGGLAPVIGGNGDVVVWSDFQDIFEVGDDPLEFSEVYSWSPLGLPDLVFDARQYTAEVRRATAARDWESDRWQTALLLRTYLREDRLTPGDEWELGFAEPDSERARQYRITYWTEDLRTVATMSLTAEPRTPEQQARTMYNYLLTTPTARWPTTQHTNAKHR
jgi:hypothetical protein